MFAWFDKIGRLNHTGQRFFHRMSVRSQMAAEEGRHMVEDRVGDTFDALPRMSQLNPLRLRHRVSVQTQLGIEQGRQMVEDTVEEGREVLQNVASSLLTSLAAPVAWTDDVLGHKVGFLGWTREQLNQLVLGLEHVHAEAPAHTDVASATPETQAESEERRKFDRRQFMREGSGRRAMDQSLKDQAEQVAPRMDNERIDLKGPVDEVARFAGPLREIVSTPGLNVEMTLNADSKEITAAEPITASIGEILSAHVQSAHIQQLAIPNYDQLNVHKIVAALRRVDTRELPTLVAYERTNKNRKSVLDAMERVMISGKSAL